MLALFLSEDIIISSFSIRPFKKHSYFHISSDGYWAYLPCNQKVTPSANMKTKDPSYRVVKAGQLLHQAKLLTQGQIQQNIPHLMGEINAMETIS
jgi:hypothetical protein